MNKRYRLGEIEEAVSEMEVVQLSIHFGTLAVGPDCSPLGHGP